MIRNVILDFDDTLTHTHHGEYLRHAQVAKKLNLDPVTERIFLSNWGPPWSEFINTLWPKTNIETFRGVYLSTHKMHSLTLIKGARSTLRFLENKGYETYLLTSRDEKSLTRHLTKHALQDHFRHIHAAEHAKYHKPNPRVFERFMQKQDIDPAQSMYVGDLLIDYSAANGAGLRFVAVLTGAHTRKRFLKAGLNPKNIIPSIKNLPLWLKKHNT